MHAKTANQRRLVSLLFLLALVPVAVSSPLSTNTESTAHDVFSRADEDITSPSAPISCQTARAPDYYGLGVRLGIYFAWCTAYIANTMLPSEIAGALDTNAIFLFTLLVAMINCSSINMLEQLDGLILVHLAAGSMFSVLSIWGYRTCQYKLEGPRAIRHFGGFGTHLRLLISLAVSVFALWFWMFGVTGALDAIDLKPDPDNGNDVGNPKICEDMKTFMFAKVDARRGARTFYIVFWICWIVYFGTMFLVSSLAGYSRVRKMIELAREKRWADTTRLRYATGLKYAELSLLFTVLRYVNFLLILLSVLFVEFTLNFNHVTAVLGGPNDNELHLPAQLLPLLIGAGGFIRICWLKFEEWRSPQDHEPSVSSPDAQRHRRAATLNGRLKKGLGVLQLFSPRMSVEGIERPVRDPDEMDELERGRGVVVRWLVAWLPWLSLLAAFREVDEAEIEARRQSVEERKLGRESVGTVGTMESKRTASEESK